VQKVGGVEDSRVLQPVRDLPRGEALGNRQPDDDRTAACSERRYDFAHRLVRRKVVLGRFHRQIGAFGSHE